MKKGNFKNKFQKFLGKLVIFLQWFSNEEGMDVVLYSLFRFSWLRNLVFIVDIEMKFMFVRLNFIGRI